jgi:hypothetical protein
MKDLIVIGAYCPDDEREKLLSDFIDNLKTVKKDFDILVCSHTFIPEYITKKVDYVFFDKNNDLLYDMEYLNQPWFSFESRDNRKKVILSTFVNGVSTYLSVYRVLISGINIAKLFLYEKIHYLEYDTIMNDFTDLYENSKLLDIYDNVVINGSPHHEWCVGFFMSLKLNNLDKMFCEFNREKLLDRLYNSKNKTNEKITEDILNSNNRKTYFKNYHYIMSKNNKYNLSNSLKNSKIDGWFVPYYDNDINSVILLAWNDRFEEKVNVTFIINNQKIVALNDLAKYEWKIHNLGDLEKINSIVTLVNNNKKNEIIFDEKTRELFRSTNYTKYE